MAAAGPPPPAPDEGEEGGAAPPLQVLRDGMRHQAEQLPSAGATVGSVRAAVFARLDGRQRPRPAGGAGRRPAVDGHRGRPARAAAVPGGAVLSYHLPGLLVQWMPAKGEAPDLARATFVPARSGAAAAVARLGAAGACGVSVGGGPWVPLPGPEAEAALAAALVVAGRAGTGSTRAVWVR